MAATPARGVPEAWVDRGERVSVGHAWVAMLAHLLRRVDVFRGQVGHGQIAVSKVVRPDALQNGVEPLRLLGVFDGDLLDIGLTRASKRLPGTGRGESHFRL